MLSPAGPLQLESRELPAASFAEWPVLPEFEPATLAHVREIAYRGELNGLRKDAFLKVGDSNTADPEAFTPLGIPSYNAVRSGLTALGDAVTQTYVRHLHPIGSPGENSFTRRSLSSRAGWVVPQMLTGLGAEILVSRAAVGLILAGTNDHYRYTTAEFKSNLQAVLHQMTMAGVVPVLSTIPWDRYIVGPDADRHILAYNQAIVDLAAENHVPVVNLWRALAPLPNTGLKFATEWTPRDYRHLSASPNGSGGFTAIDLQYGQNVRHLLALQVLTLLRQYVFEPPVDLPTPAAWVPLTAGQAVFATGTGPGLPTIITVADTANGHVLNQLTPYGAGFRGGASVAVGDVDDDGIADVVVGAGFGGGPHVCAYSGADGHELFGFFAFEPTFTGGVTVAVGEDEIAVGAGPGGGPRVRVFRLDDFALVRDFFAYESTFRGGVTVAIGSAGLVVGSGTGGGPIVKVYDGTGHETATIVAYDAAFRGGVNVAAGDVGEIVTGPGVGGAPHVRVFDVHGAERAGFFADDPTTTGGAAVAVVGERIAALTGTGVRLFDPTTDPFPLFGAQIGG